MEFYISNCQPNLNIVFTYISGVRVVYNLKKERSNRVVSVEVRCSSCDIPEYSLLDLEEYYMVVTNNYMVGGGDGFNMISKEMLQHFPMGKVMISYLNYLSILILL